MSMRLLVKAVIGLVVIGLVGLLVYAKGATVSESGVEKKAKQIVSVRFENAHIRSVLRYLSEIIGVNIVLDEGVFSEDGKVIQHGISPRVTVDLKDLPLIDALTIILRAKDLIYRIEENLIWITTPDRMVLKTTTRVKSGEVIGDAELRLEEKAKQLISITYENAHLRTVLTHLNRRSGINIVLDENVFPGEKDPKAGITIHLKDIPLLEALDVILRSKGLRYTIVENIIWISTPERIGRRRPR